MVSMVCCVFLSCSYLLLASAAPVPWPSNFETPQQACGDRLADMMSLVCTNGYNTLFRTEQSSTRRYRRQIVEECCHRSCGPDILKQYCLADDTTESPNNVQIRKRSDSEMDSSKGSDQAEEITRNTQETLNSELSSRQNSIFQSPQENTQKSTTTNPTNFKRVSDDNKVINLLEPLKRSRKNKNRKNINKSIQNETTEEEDSLKQSIPPLRHNKNHHHTRQLRRRKSSGRTKSYKGTSSESTTTPSFLIGTLKPYFAVSSSNNLTHS